ncbi:MAG: ankyrin repeat domain-containing protein [Flavobacteriales bacterium]|jgi:ankyrin repeat protein|nr:ankyrin repeat domain-containing protein [Flavobacteriales bacterium]
MKKKICIGLFSLLLINCQIVKDKKIENKKEAVDLLSESVTKKDSLAVKKILATSKIKSFNIQYELDSLLIEAVKWNSFSIYQQLLKYGANPNWYNSKSESAMIEACYKFETSRYVISAINYGADVNNKSMIKNDFNATPLIAASAIRLETVKILVENGADINYMNDLVSPLFKSLTVGNNPKIVRYLLVEKEASLKIPSSHNMVGVTIEKLLRRWTFPLDSEDYKIKMEIVDFLEKKGYDYKNAPIPEHYYKNYSKEYLEKY